MQLIRTLASYYRQSHLHILRAQAPLNRQLSVGRRPRTFPFQQACRHLTGHPPSSSSHRDDGLLAHNINDVPGTYVIPNLPSIAPCLYKDGKDTVAAPRLPPAAPRKSRFYTWAKWALGSFITLLLSLWSTRWQKLLLIGSEVQNAVKVVDTAAEVVEEVATAAEKVSAEVAEMLPDGGKLKKMALAVEKASVEAVAGAEAVEDIIHKVDELEQEVKTLLKPVVDPSNQGRPSVK